MRKEKKDLLLKATTAAATISNSLLISYGQCLSNLLKQPAFYDAVESVLIRLVGQNLDLCSFCGHPFRKEKNQQRKSKMACFTGFHAVYTPFTTHLCVKNRTLGLRLVAEIT